MVINILKHFADFGIVARKKGKSMRLKLKLSYSFHDPTNLELIHHVPFSSNHYRMKTPFIQMG
jgi:hypothetical protein